jgi:hypothetical protein
VQTAKEIGFMTGITLTTHWATTAAAVGSRGLHTALAVGALLVMALLVAVFLAVQSGHGARGTAVPMENLVQQDRVIDQATLPIYFPGRPH